MPSEFPAEIDLFIGQHIESLAQLEALLTLRGEPKRGWNCADLARQLYVPSDVCNGIVVELERRGFVMRDTANPDVFYYRPGSEETDRLIGRLAELYQERRVAVITQIYSKPVKKVQTFADAFRLRKEP